MIICKGSRWFLIYYIILCIQRSKRSIDKNLNTTILNGNQITVYSFYLGFSLVFFLFFAFTWFGCHFWRTLNIFQIEMKQRLNALLVVDGSGKLINRIKVVQYKYCDTGQNWTLQTLLMKSDILLILAGCENPGSIF